MHNAKRDDMDIVVSFFTMVILVFALSFTLLNTSDGNKDDMERSIDAMEFVMQTITNCMIDIMNNLISASEFIIDLGVFVIEGFAHREFKNPPRLRLKYLEDISIIMPDVTQIYESWTVKRNMALRYVGINI